MNSVNNVFLSACCNRNFGDDVLIMALCRRYPNTSFFCVVQPEHYEYYNSFTSNFHPVICSNHDRWAALIIGSKNVFYQCIKECDDWIILGGSIFNETNKWFRTVIYRRFMVKHFRKSYILGANVGGIVGRKFVFLNKCILKHFDDVCFRDSYSYVLFKDLKNVRHAPDIALTYIINDKQGIKHEEKEILINFIFLKNHFYDLTSKKLELQNRILDIIGNSLTRGYRVKLLSLCKGEDLAELDSSWMKILENKFPKADLKRISILEYNHNDAVS